MSEADFFEDLEDLFVPQVTPPAANAKKDTEETHYSFHVRVNAPMQMGWDGKGDDPATHNPELKRWVEQVLNLLQTHACAFTCQLERGALTGCLHMQIAMKVRTKMRNSEMVKLWYTAFPYLRSYLVDECHLRIPLDDRGDPTSTAYFADEIEWYVRPQRSKDDDAHANAYCMKADGRVLGPWTKTPPASQNKKRRYEGEDPTERQRRLLKQRNYPFYTLVLKVMHHEDPQASSICTPPTCEQVRAFLERESGVFSAFSCQLEEDESGQLVMRLVVKTTPKRTRSNFIALWYAEFPYLRTSLLDENNTPIAISTDGSLTAVAYYTDERVWSCQPQVCRKEGSQKDRYCMPLQSLMRGRWTSKNLRSAVEMDLTAQTGIASDASSENNAPRAATASQSVVSTPACDDECPITPQRDSAKRRRMTWTPPRSKGWPGRDSGQRRALSYCTQGLTYEMLYPWQKLLLEKLRTPPDDRTVIWVHEKAGSAGKSAFCKFLGLANEEKFPSQMVDSQGEEYLPCIRPVFSGGKAADLKWLIAQYAIKYKQAPNIVLFDIARTHKDTSIEWHVVEEIKNGHIVSQKYDSQEVIFNSPHVVVFSNAEPPLDKLSKDRWQILTIPSSPADSCSSFLTHDMFLDAIAS